MERRHQMERTRDDAIGLEAETEAETEMIGRGGPPGSKQLAVLESVVAALESGKQVPKATVRRAREALRLLRHQVLAE
jgi:hypothetical protein